MPVANNNWEYIGPAATPTSMQVQSGQVLVTFYTPTAAELPDTNYPGFLLDEYDGITNQYGTGNMYAKSSDGSMATLVVMT